MINSLRIKNFQSHKKTFMEFSSGVNVIVGESNSGKTAIIRSLKKLIWNKPSGDSFRSKWGGNTHISIETDTHKVARNIGVNNNYVVGELDSEEVQEFKALGANVPDEISELLRMSEINLQQQLDAPFLISETSGKVAAFFNELAGIDLIDKSLKNIQKEINSTNNSIKTRKSDLKEKKAEMSQYDNIEELDSKVTALEQLDKRKIALGKSLRDLAIYFETYEELKIQISKIENYLLIEPKIIAVFEKVNSRNELKKNIIALNSLITSFNSLIEEESEIHKIVQSEKNVNELIENNKVFKELKFKIVNLKSIIDDLLNFEIQIKSLEETIENLSTEYSKIKICPFCGSKINQL